jgi:hypothetical protein
MATQGDVVFLKITGRAAVTAEDVFCCRKIMKRVKKVEGGELGMREGRVGEKDLASRHIEARKSEFGIKNSPEN